jgi:hypothetical protein
MANIQGVVVCDQCDVTIPAKERLTTSDGRDLCQRCAAAAQIAPSAEPGAAGPYAPAYVLPTPQGYAPSQPRPKSVNGLGIAALVLGILACLICWIPIVGIVSLPLAGLGLIFALAGFLMALIGRRSGVGMPVSGGIVCAAAIVVQIIMTGGLVAVMNAENTRRAAPQTRASSPAELAYRQHLTLSQVRLVKTVLNQPAVFGEITNTGDRTVTDIAATIYCLGADGRPVYETSAQLLAAKPRMFGTRGDPPLKPGYSSKFGGFTIEGPPSTWAGQVSIEITRIEFAD